MSEKLGTVPPPAPAPKPEGEEVLPSLLRWLFDRGHLARIPDLALKLLARDALGRKKYGQPLRADDGRDDGRDLEDELLDALQYAHKLALRGAVTEAHRTLAAMVLAVLGCSDGPSDPCSSRRIPLAQRPKEPRSRVIPGLGNPMISRRARS